VCNIDVTCRGLSYGLYRYTTDDDTEYEGKTTGEIADQLYDDFIAPYETWTLNITTATGVTIDDAVIFDTMTIGDCLAQLVDMDGHICYVDWDSGNSRPRLNYVQPSEPGTPKVFSDDAADNPDRQILHTGNTFYEGGHNIWNKVIVELGEGFKYLWNQTTATLNVSYFMPYYKRRVAQIFKATRRSVALSAVQLYGYNTGEVAMPLKCRVYKCLYNESANASWSFSTNADGGSGDNANVYDEDLTTYAEWTLADGASVTIKADFGSAKGVPYAYLKLDDFTDLDVDIDWSADNSSWTEWEGDITASGMVKKASETEKRYWRVVITNNTGGSHTVKVYQVAFFIEGYDASHFNVGWDYQNSLGETDIIVPHTGTATWSGWHFFPFDIPLTAYNYYVVSFEYMYDDGTTMNYIPYTSHSTDAYADGKLILADSDGEWELETSLTKDVTMKLGFGFVDKIRVVADAGPNGSDASAYEQHTYIYRNPLKMGYYRLAEAIAEYIVGAHYDGNAWGQIEVEGIAGLSMAEKIRVHMNALSDSSDDLAPGGGLLFEVDKIEHEVIGNRWRTYIKIGKPAITPEGMLAALNMGRRYEGG
jgi:hypothetical protein